MNQGSIVFRVTRTIENATYSQIMQLVVKNQNTKAPITQQIDKIIKYVVRVIIIVSLLVWLFWFLMIEFNPGIIVDKIEFDKKYEH